MLRSQVEKSFVAPTLLARRCCQQLEITLSNQALPAYNKEHVPVFPHSQTSSTATAHRPSTGAAPMLHHFRQAQLNACSRQQHMYVHVPPCPVPSHMCNCVEFTSTSGRRPRCRPHKSFPNPTELTRDGVITQRTILEKTETLFPVQDDPFRYRPMVEKPVGVQETGRRSLDQTGDVPWKQEMEWGRSQKHGDRVLNEGAEGL